MITKFAEYLTYLSWVAEVDTVSLALFGEYEYPKKEDFE
mgnify:FL=1